MKTVKTILLLTVLLSSTMFAQTKTFSYLPEKPIPGEEITVTFNPQNTILEKSKEIKMIVLQYAVDLLSTDQFEMKAVNGMWRGNFTPRENNMTTVIVFTSDAGYESNNSRGYIIPMCTKEGGMLPGAVAALGIFKGSAGDFTFVPDFNKSVELFEEEFNKNPLVKSSFLGVYLFTLKRCKPQIYKSIVKNELSLLAKKEKLSEDELKTCATYYKEIGDTVQTKIYEAKLKEVNPGNRYFQYQKLLSLFTIKNLDDKLEFAHKFREEFPDGEMNNELNIIVSNTMLEGGDCLGAYEYWNKYQNRTSLSFANSVAWKMYEKGDNIQKAAEIAQEAVSYGRKALADKTYKRENYMTAETAEMAFKFDLGYLEDTYGSILMKLNKKEEAYKAFEEAFLFAGRSSEEISEHYFKSLIDKKEFKKAKEGIEKLAASVGIQGKLLDVMKEIYSAAGDPQMTFEQYLSGLQNKAEEKLINYYKAEMTKEPAGDFTLTDLTGKTVSLSDYKGQAVVVDFWSTSCGPCIASLPVLKIIVPQLEKELNIKFLFVNTQESDGDKKVNLEKFIKENQYTFHVLLDAGSVVMNKYRILGIPTQLIIDKEGVIRFRKVGFGGSLEDNMKILKIMFKLIGI